MSTAGRCGSVRSAIVGSIRPPLDTRAKPPATRSRSASSRSGGSSITWAVCRSASARIARRRRTRSASSGRARATSNFAPLEETATCCEAEKLSASRVEDNVKTKSTSVSRSARVSGDRHPGVTLCPFPSRFRAFSGVSISPSVGFLGFL